MHKCVLYFFRIDRILSLIYIHWHTCSNQYVSGYAWSISINKAISCFCGRNCFIVSEWSRQMYHDVPSVVKLVAPVHRVCSTLRLHAESVEACIGILAHTHHDSSTPPIMTTSNLSPVTSCTHVMFWRDCLCNSDKILYPQVVHNLSLLSAGNCLDFFPMYSVNACITLRIYM